MKKIATHHFSIFAGAAILFVGLLGPVVSHASGFTEAQIPCTSKADAGQDCGFQGLTFTMSAGCTINGASIVTDPSINGNQPVRVLGGQICGVVGASDQAGYYSASTGQTTPALSYPGATPYGWTYDKAQPSSIYSYSPLASSLPSGEFVDPANPYQIERFFNGGGMFTSFGAKVDDAETLTIGSNSESYNGACLAAGEASHQSGPACTISGSILAANPGDPVSYTVTNAYAPSDGPVGEWGQGTVVVSLYVTACDTANYLQQQGGYTDLVDYHPTADGVCTPSAPTLSTNWQAGGTNQTVTLTPGQTSVTVPFTYTNGGQATSKVEGIKCNQAVTSGNLPAQASINSSNCSPTTIQN